MNSWIIKAGDTVVGHHGKLHVAMSMAFAVYPSEQYDIVLSKPGSERDEMEFEIRWKSGIVLGKVYNNQWQG